MSIDIFILLFIFFFRQLKHIKMSIGIELRINFKYFLQEIM